MPLPGTRIGTDHPDAVGHGPQGPARNRPPLESGVSLRGPVHPYGAEQLNDAGMPYGGARHNRVARAVGLAVTILTAVVCVFGWWLVHIPPRRSAFFPFPPERECAIAITDDTDFFQFTTTGPVYALLDSLGIRVTKTVWAFDPKGGDPASSGLSLENRRYRDWVIREAARGHEIVLHSPSSLDDDRSAILEAHALVSELTGGPLRVESFHSDNREAFYWGSYRVPNPLLSWLYRVANRGDTFLGHVEGSPYYWVDVSRRLVRYVRTYTTNDINTLALNPSMPYEDPGTPMAPLWFASSNGRYGSQFATLLRLENVERLKSERGVSIVYTHFASGFAARSGFRRSFVRRDIRRLLVRYAADPAIEFVPAGEVLDRLRTIQLVQDFVAATAVVDSARPMSLELPAELLPAVDGVSVDPAALPGPYGRGFADGVRVPLREWLAAVGVELRPSSAGVFENARVIGWRERWRLVLRWLATQLTSPT